MTCWFDFYHMRLMSMKGATIEEFWAEFNQDELKESADYILRLIEKEAEHLNNDTTKIFLGGVS